MWAIWYFEQDRACSIWASNLPNIKAHNVFHVSLLNKYVHDPNHIINWNLIQVEFEGDFQVQPVHILDREVDVLRNRAIG